MACKRSRVRLPQTPPVLQFGGLAHFGRASALHAEGERFETVILHQIHTKIWSLNTRKRDIIMAPEISVIHVGVKAVVVAKVEFPPHNVTDLNAYYKGLLKVVTAAFPDNVVVVLGEGVHLSSLDNLE